MARSRNNRRRPAGRGPRRNLFWARFSSLTEYTPSNFNFSVDALTDFKEAYGANLFGFTVYRIVGHFTHWSTGDLDTSETYNLSWGIRVDDQSEATNVPDADNANRIPVADPYADWMYASNNIGIAGEVNEDYPALRQNRVYLDLKAKRKLSELHQGLYIMGGLNTAPSDGGTYSWHDLHILLAQP